ncbi:MAG: HEAT repeat domain-containing protein [Candidatus Methylomirabilis oxyfera]|nr:HEAT repeat domain-containing protein [Candidatus Methylomirabilis oxyfera]
MVLGLLLEPSVRIPLAQRLEDSDGYVRLYAALALAKMRDPSALSYLQTTLRENNKSLGLFAGELLSNLGDRSAIPFLRATLRSDRDIPTRLYAAWTLGRLGDQSGLASVFDLERLTPSPLLPSSSGVLPRTKGNSAFRLRVSRPDPFPSDRGPVGG